MLIIEGIEVIRSKANDPFSFYKSFIGKNKNDSLSSSEVISTENKSVCLRIAIWIRMNLFVPDARVGWYFSATKMISKYLESNKIYSVITIGPPHSAIRAASMDAVDVRELGVVAR